MITIFGELYSSKNSKQIVKRGGRPFLIASSAYLAHKKPIQQQLALNRYNWIKEKDGAVKPLKIEFKIYRKTKRRFDYVNIIQGLLDCMTECGWIEDDNADEVIPVFLPYEVDPKNPRVEINVKKI